MFDFDLGKMILVAVVALVVLGPEKLPRAARLAGLWVRRVRAYWFNLQSELERELAAEELRTRLRETEAALREARGGIESSAGTATPPAPALPASRPAAGSSTASDHAREA